MGIINICGASETRIAPIISYMEKEEGKDVRGLIIVSSAIRAKRLAADLSFFVQKNIYVMPEENELLIAYEAKNRDELFQRLAALKALRSGEDCIVIAPVSAAVKKILPHSIFEEKSIKLEMGADVDIENLRESLSAMGYERVGLVEARGEYSIRGGIIDIFTPDASQPYRVELFDTEVDSVRCFDLDTQRTLESLKSIEIYPAQQLIRDEALFKAAADGIYKEYSKYIAKLEKQASRAPEQKKASALQRLLERIENLKKRRGMLTEFAENAINLQLLENFVHYFYKDTEYLWDYLRDDALIMVDDPDRIDEILEVRSRELADDFELLVEKGLAVPRDLEIITGKEDFVKIYKSLAGDSKPAESGSAAARSCENARDIYIFTPFKKKLADIEHLDGLQNVVSKQTPVFNGRMDFLASELKNYIKSGYKICIACATAERLENMRDFLEREELSGRVELREGSLTSGVEFPEKKLCYISDADIFTGQKLSGNGRKKKKKRSGQAIRSFSDMKKGDYVVHENHGIGKFLGIEQVSIQNVKKDYLKIKYAGEDMLYVPVEQMDLIQKYVGAEGAAPKLNKLSGGEWKKTKAKAKAAIASMAKELLELSARRKVTPGHAFGPDTIWQKEFEDSFPYSETDDQLRCIEEIKKDMEKPEPMDRLLCGDVGFGKTEVAARAMFKCIADGKQAAVLVPTTLLANQHYYTLKERFERFPCTVGMLSRFRSEKQQEFLLDGISKGSVDLLIGTHRILSKDVKFKDLGLLVIDEEQRFGVQHKEAIKRLRENVDVLTLSATPIPRTLHMSLLGIKDMSLIEEPPEERYPVQTYVMEQDELMIKEAIERELGRGGQVYVVYNRVRGIHAVAAMIERLVPEAKIAIGHGQMNEGTLEDVMMGFVEGETNVLIATTIIESGIDIPNVNTMLILDADMYGLSQLYQLRGRVGRSNRLAYAYLMYRKDKSLSEVAEKRLRAIKEFTEFGAGFKVAMRDLEIRGAGNILGTEQSGHMNMVGYELYCKLVDDAVRALGGEIVNPDHEESSIELPVTAYIPESYIADEVLKLQMYKKIAAVENADDEEEVTDELIDRFGELPKATAALIKVSRIRSLAEKLCITRIHEQEGRVVLEFAEINVLKPGVLAALSAKYGMRIFIHGGVKPFLRFTPSAKTVRKNLATAPKRVVSSRDVLLETIELLEDMMNPERIKSSF